MREIDLSAVTIHPSVAEQWRKIVWEITPKLAQMGIKKEDIPDERARVDDEKGVLVIYVSITIPQGDSQEFSLKIPHGWWSYLS